MSDGGQFLLSLDSCGAGHSRRVRAGGAHTVPGLSRNPAVPSPGGVHSGARAASQNVVGTRIDGAESAANQPTAPTQRAMCVLRLWPGVTKSGLRIEREGLSAEGKRSEKPSALCLQPYSETRSNAPDRLVSARATAVRARRSARAFERPNSFGVPSFGVQAGGARLAGGRSGRHRPRHRPRLNYSKTLAHTTVSPSYGMSDSAIMRRPSRRQTPCSPHPGNCPGLRICRQWPRRAVTSPYLQPSWPSNRPRRFARRTCFSPVLMRWPRPASPNRFLRRPARSGRCAPRSR